MPCTHPVYDYEKGEKPCGRPVTPGDALDRCWRHSTLTESRRSLAARSAARTRRRRRSWWGRLLETIAMPARAVASLFTRRHAA